MAILVKESPQALFLSLHRPAKTWLSFQNLNSKSSVWVAGEEVVGNDAPQICAVADLLVNEKGEFVGMTFPVVGPEMQAAIRQMVENTLDSRVVRYNMLATDATPYGDVTNGTHFVEIVWGNVRRMRCDVAQLLVGQWFWWYSTIGDSRIPEPGISTPPVAFSLEDIDEVLQDHSLTFPKSLEFEELAVQFVEP